MSSLSYSQPGTDFEAHFLMLILLCYFNTLLFKTTLVNLVGVGRKSEMSVFPSFVGMFSAPDDGV